ncbi:MAG: hypothetical protein QNJ18_22750 [Xenococcaceae cyanobacterium MO_167.B52]|nr:hypothetical protein [Xenococcaceae cyanobacterium MO_167.B52]
MVWKKATPPPGIAEVLRAETQLQQEIATATIPTTPNSNMKRLGWSERQGKEYLIKKYGKSSRLHLTDAQLIEFNNFLKSKIK